MTEEIAAEVAKTELHLHLEGALSVQRALALAEAANDVPPAPADAFVDVGGERRWNYRGLGGFLKLFAWGTRLLRGPDSYGPLLEDLLEALEGQGVRYAEVFVAIGQMRRAGVDPGEVIPTLARIARERHESGGPQLWFIADVTRQWGVAEAEAGLDAALALQEHRIVGYGMGGDEDEIRAREFRAVFRRARESGLRLTCHAGEGTSADAVREVVEELEVERVGHGIAAVEDPRLLRELAEARVVLEVCPTSNRRTGAWREDEGPHPVGALIQAKVPVVLGSDDPAFFDSSLPAEFALLRSWGFEDEILAQLETTAQAARFVA